MFRSCVLTGTILAATLFTAGCSTAPSTTEDRVDIRQEADAAVSKARSNDPSLVRFLDDAEGYAVFPKVGKGAVGVGGAYGRGVLYHHGRQVGFCDLSQGSIGLQLGGQRYTEIIAFGNDAALNEFKNNNMEFSAQASAVALKSGSGANAKYDNGVAVFTMDESGLMFEASVGGQRFTFEPFRDVD